MEDSFDFLGEIFVAGFFVVEVFGSFRGVVDDFRDLGAFRSCKIN